MERLPMSMDWQNKYCENDNIPKSTRKIKFNSCQNSNDIIHKSKKNLKSIWKHKDPE
jgi:hypothetical protein